MLVFLKKEVALEALEALEALKPFVCWKVFQGVKGNGGKSSVDGRVKAV